MSDRAAEELTDALHRLQTRNGELREFREYFEHERMRYADLYDFSPVGYMSLDADARIEEINLAGGLILGDNPNRLSGRSFTDFVGPEDVARFMDHLSETAQSTRRLSVQIRLITGISKPGNAPVDVELFTIATRDADRDKLQFRSAILNITERKAAEQALWRSHLELERRVEDRTREVTQSHNLLGAVIDKASDVVYAKDLEGRYRLVNAAGARFIGRPVEEIIGRRDEELFPPATARENVENDGKVREQKTTLTFESLVTSYVAQRWFQTTAGLYTDEQGAVVGIAGIARDITERRERENAHRFLSAAGVVLAASLDYGTTLASIARLSVPQLADCCVVDVISDDAGLRRAAVTHRQPEQEPLVWSLDQFRDSDGVFGRTKVLRTGRSEMYSQITPEFECTIARSAEQLRLMRLLSFRSYMCVPLNTRGRTIGAIGFLREGGSPEYGASDLALAEELAERAAIAIDNATLYMREQEANRLKDDFLARVSHELRTPLTPILGAIYMLRLRDRGKEDAETPLDIIERNARRQAQIVEDLLDISRIAQGTLELHRRETDISAVVETAVGLVRPAAERLGIRVDTSFVKSASTLQCDPDRVHQVMSNLLSNAIKFTPPGGRIRVKTENRPNGARIIVSDTGVGIRPEFLPHVFERFRQAGQFSTRTHSGLGLGLSIVRHIVEQHGGSIQAFSAGEGRGATFTIDLPFTFSDETARQ